MHPKPGKAPSRAQSLAIFAGDDEAPDIASALVHNRISISTAPFA